MAEKKSTHPNGNITDKFSHNGIEAREIDKTILFERVKEAYRKRQVSDRSTLNEIKCIKLDNKYGLNDGEQNYVGVIFYLPDKQFTSPFDFIGISLNDPIKFLSKHLTLSDIIYEFNKLFPKDCWRWN